MSTFTEHTPQSLAGLRSTWRQRPERPRVRHRAQDAVVVMVFSLAVSGGLAALLSGLTWLLASRAGA